MGAWFAPNVTQSHISFWTHLIVLGHVDQAEAHFDLFGDSFSLGTR
jgi:hypothetical protein